jgi:O-antigen/teichoic acid export membrane protein
MSVSIALGLRAVVQAVVFVIVSRTLGIEDYGAFAAILALASVFGSLGALGTPTVMLRDVALASGAFPKAWGRTLMTIAISTPVLLPIYLLLAWWILPPQFSITVIVLVGLADVILTPVNLCAITAYQGHERMGRAARLTLLLIVPRLLAAMMLWVLATIAPSGKLLLIWAALYALSALGAAVYAHRLVRRDLGMAQRPRLPSIWSAIRQGLPFAAGSAAMKTHAEINKTLLSRLSTLESTGAYSAAHRVSDLAVIPIVSLLNVTWPRFFRAGHNSRAIFALARGILPVPTAYAVLAGMCLYYAADFLPVLLGADFAAAADVLRWLAWLPLISLPRLVLQMMMASSGRQSAAVGALTIGAASNVGLNLWLIPVYSWLGAVIATFVAEMLMTVIMLFHFTSARLHAANDTKK